MAMNWTQFSDILTAFEAQLDTGQGAILDQVRAGWRDYLDNYGLNITDPAVVRGVIAGAQFGVLTTGNPTIYSWLTLALAPYLGSTHAPTGSGG